MAKQTTSQKVASALLLKPLSLVYSAVTATRNKMFDVGMLQQREFDIPVLVVGNIAVGGTGKTPHTEYLIELLKDKYHIGVLSRGYNRKTKGFLLADEQSDASCIGDEPYQIYKKYGSDGVMVAVSEDRCAGIDKMREIDPKLDLILLDDAFQHRYVKPQVSVVLTEYSRPVYTDSMLPAGHLRESIDALHRADIVVVTKCPEDMKQLEYRLFVKNLNLYPYQKLYFSQYEYGQPQPVFPDVAGGIKSLDELTSRHAIVALAGVAHPLPFVRYLRKFKAKVKGLGYPDHHKYTREDIGELIRKIKSMPDPAHTIVVTTEKDAMRLQMLPDIPKALKTRLYYIPIKVKFIPNIAEGNRPGEQDFASTVISMLGKKPKQS